MCDNHGVERDIVRIRFINSDFDNYSADNIIQSNALYIAIINNSIISSLQSGKHSTHVF